MPISTSRFVKALSETPKPKGRQLRFLRAHDTAVGRAATASTLARAAGYKSFDGVNLQYGLLARRLGSKLGKRAASLSLLVEFIRPLDVTNQQWVLVMRPEFAEALKQVGWL